MFINIAITNICLLFSYLDRMYPEIGQDKDRPIYTSAPTVPSYVVIIDQIILEITCIDTSKENFKNKLT